MNNELIQFMRIIKNSRCDNTYKMAWARAIVELCEEDPKRAIISLNEIAFKMVGYYWNQVFFFGMHNSFLYHSSNPEKLPEIISYVRVLIDIFIETRGLHKPEFFEKAQEQLDIDLPKVVRVLKSDVSWRFLNLSGEIIPLYEYNKGDNDLDIHHASVIAEFAPLLKDAINLRWASILEGFNKSTPNICKKIMLQDERGLKRKSLAWAKEYLDVQNPNHVCDICNESIVNEVPWIDHVIPWSFLYSDDIWNLVYTHRACNIRKLDAIPSGDDIDRLNKRNCELAGLLQNEKGKAVSELHMAVSHDYVIRLWKACGGH